MEASSPGEGLSQTPPGLGGISRAKEREETESLQLPLQPVCSNVFSRWTHTDHR